MHRQITEPPKKEKFANQILLMNAPYKNPQVREAKIPCWRPDEEIRSGKNDQQNYRNF